MLKVIKAIQTTTIPELHDADPSDKLKEGKESSRYLNFGTTCYNYIKRSSEFQTCKSPANHT